MAESIFFRSPKITHSFDANYKVRNNAYAKITGFGPGGQGPTNVLSAAVNRANFSNNNSGVYNFDGRPNVPLLDTVTVTLEGTAGSLRRATGKFLCATLDQFDDYHNSFLRPGCKITIEYGYVGPNTPSKGGKHEFIVYDFNFKLTADNTVECEFKAVGQGSAIERQAISAGTTAFAQQYQGKEFTNQYGFLSEEKTKVASLLDALDYRVQEGTNQLGDNLFDPPHGSSKIGSSGAGNPAPGKTMGGYVVLVAPENYQPADGITMNTGELASWRLQYWTLGEVVYMINRWASPNGETSELRFWPCNVDLRVRWAGGTAALVSSDPLSIAWVYPKGSTNADGTFANRYAGSEEAASGDASGATYLDFDNISGIGSFFISHGFQNFLIGRDYMRSIEKNFTRQKESGGNTTSLMVREFLEKIFDAIKEATAGKVKLQIIDDPDAFNLTSKPTTAISWIVNVNDGPITTVTPFTFDPLKGDGITRELTLTGKVPKSVQQEAFVAATGTGDAQEGAGGLAFGGAAPDTTDTGNLSDVLKKLHDSKYTNDGIGAVKAYFQSKMAASKSQLAKGGQSFTYPLDLNITLNGIEGFRFGDLVTSKFLPNFYKTGNNGLKIGFTVTRIEHTIQNADWTTSLTATCRLY